MTATTACSVATGAEAASQVSGSAEPAGSVPVRLLVVCRANQCRSPLAAAIGNRLAAGSDLRFDSAGLLPGGHPMPRRGLKVARERGLDLRQHRSRELRSADIGAADLVLAMSRGHAREVLLDDPDLWPRLFTLKQFSRWVRAHPRPDGADVRAWLEDAAADRDRSELLGSSPADDVADPVRARVAGWRRTADELEAHLRVVVGGLLGSDARRGLRAGR